MAVKKYYVNSKKPGYPFDRNAKKFYSWGYDIWIDRARRQERGFQTKTDAETAVTRLKQQEKMAAHGAIASSKIPALIELFQKKLDTFESKHDRARAKRVFTYFLALLPKKILVTELRTAHLQEFVTARLATVSAQTVRRELVPIVSALRSAYMFYASLEDYTPPRVPRPKVVKSKKERVISETEREKLFAWFFEPQSENETSQQHSTRRRTGQFLLFCLLTLSRPGEIAALRKTDIDLSLGRVAITGRKSRFTATQIVRRLSITRTMREILLERIPRAPGDYVFTRSGYVTPKMYDRMKEACEANGIKYSRTDPEGISFHTTRHTGITMLLQGGLDLKTVGGLAGQSDSQMTMYYTHTSPELVKKAGEILERKIANNVRLGEPLESRAIVTA